MPAGQTMQSLAPVLSRYWPAAQAEQEAAPAAANRPLSQLVQLDACGAEYWPKEHGSQLPLPAAPW